MPTPSLVTLHVWGVGPGQVPAAVLAMALDRRPLRHQDGLTFAKLLGTGSGTTFSPRDADLGHWGVLACWSNVAAATAFDRSALVRRWDGRSHERLRLHLSPLSSRGRWARSTPFGEPAARAYDGPAAALTRARIKPHRWRAFWQAVPPVAAALRAAPGLQLALGIGEAPVGLQGTLSLWSSMADLDDFAYRRAEHREVIRRTREVGWYAEELFARFAVLAADGTYGGQPVGPPGT